MVRQARVETRRSVQQGTQICKGVGNKIKVQQKTGKAQKTKDKEKSKKKKSKTTGWHWHEGTEGTTIIWQTKRGIYILKDKREGRLTGHR